MSTHQTPSYRTGANAALDGLDITISLTPGEAAALGVDADMLADWFDTALWALALLRTGDNEHGNSPGENARDITADTLYTVINDLDHRLLPRLQGLRDAAIRRHNELGGSLNNLALAMDVSKSTAQSRRNAVLDGRDRPSAWENWAVKDGPRGTKAKHRWPNKPVTEFTDTELVTAIERNQFDTNAVTRDLVRSCVREWERRNGLPND
ncbi:hypothetical protein [Streptomyces sp. NPDC057966]|uniref:hypothetical protein n=1 Tax=Streptomyces sp. NPDC057966 TaxID=3346292 RepID=UPI0036F09FAC